MPSSKGGSWCKENTFFSFEAFLNISEIVDISQMGIISNVFCHSGSHGVPVRVKMNNSCLTLFANSYFMFSLEVVQL